MRNTNKLMSIVCIVLIAISAAVPTKATPSSVGTATWSVELFTIGCSYLIYPVKQPIYEGETAAEGLLRLLHDHGFAGYYTGTPRSAFYLGYIADGDAVGTRYNGYLKSGTPSDPKKLGVSPSIPNILIPHLSATMTFFDPEDYKKNYTGYLGEFVITNGAGWMYTVNNSFLNVSLSDIFLSDGDVVRVQFTLAYGADIGGVYSAGDGSGLISGYFPVANKDALTRAIYQTRSAGEDYASALTVMETLDAAQSSVDAAVRALNNAPAASASDTDMLPQTSSAVSSSKANTVTRQETGDRTVSIAEESDTPVSSADGNKLPETITSSAADEGTPESGSAISSEAVNIEDNPVNPALILVIPLTATAAAIAVMYFRKGRNKDV